MKKSGLFAAAFFLALSSGAFAADTFDQALPGTYMVTVNYVRGGASLSQMFTFAI